MTMAYVHKKSVYMVQILMVFFFNLFILGFFGWFFYLIYTARSLHQSTGPGTAIAAVAIPIVGILLWVVNYTAWGLLSDEAHSLFGRGRRAKEGQGNAAGSAS
jgi:hypothetical protein